MQKRFANLVFSLVTAVQFLTILPVKLWRDPRDTDVAQALRYFPLVGGLLGMLLLLIYWLASLALPFPLPALLTVVGLLAITGALHFDGFMDSCDGLLGYATTERRLEIMRDSRVGSFAVAGGWALLTLKFAGLAIIPPGRLAAALLIAPVMGRWALVLAVALFPYGRESGLGKLYKQHNTRLEMLLASPFVILLAVGVLGLPGLGLAVIIALFAWLCGKWVMAKLPAGLTGDSYGMITELAEMLSWLVLASFI